jgi:hypothetical protein
MAALIKLLAALAPQLLKVFGAFQLPKSAPKVAARRPVKPKTAADILVKKEAPKEQPKEEPAPVKQLISLDDYITASGKYPARASSPELTEEVLKNAKTLLEKLNAFLNELGVTEVRVSSGFRPASANAKAGGAKRSAHMTGEACDLADSDGALDRLIEQNHGLLKKYGLWLEAPSKTPSWAHLDIRQRSKREKNIFFP